MSKHRIFICLGMICISLLFTACRVPYLGRKTENKTVPDAYNNVKDSVNTARVKWKQFFTDPNLTALIDTALKNNQEL
ncbi:MAG: TolC family protein, partial [Bacteroidia bacterium]